MIYNVKPSKPKWNCSIQNCCEALYLVDSQIPRICTWISWKHGQDKIYLRCLKEKPSAFKTKLTPAIWVFCSRLIISKRVKAAAKNSFGKIAAGSQLPAILGLVTLEIKFQENPYPFCVELQSSFPSCPAQDCKKSASSPRPVLVWKSTKKELLKNISWNLLWRKTSVHAFRKIFSECPKGPEKFQGCLNFPISCS